MSRMLKVLIAHNAYQQRGGEDSVVDSECELLRAHGHEVEVFRRHNDDVAGMSKAALALQTVWSTESSQDLLAQLDGFQPDVVHVHNTLPLISPSIYWAAHRRGLPVVQTLHNFRLMCPQAMFLRDGRVCEDCLGHVPWKGVIRACYRGSRAQTAVLAASVTMHKAMGTYRDKVTRYIALNQFCRQKFVDGGLPANKVVIKPNFVEDAGLPTWDDRQSGLFVGRLSTDKGVAVLLQAQQLSGASVDVIGAGDLLEKVRQQLGHRALGFLPVAEIITKMRRASYLVVPSLWYENFPRTLVEAFSCGLPVIASRLGALAELVEDGKTGLLFEPGNAQDLAEKLSWAQANPQTMSQMGRNARLKYEQAYSPQTNYEQLLAIYQDALVSAR